MLRFRSAALALTATFALAACSGLKDALTGHTDVAARAGSQSLSVTRLSQMLATTPVPARKDVASAITNLWVNYQLLASAAARGDTLTDPKMIDDAMWAQIANLKGRKFAEALQKAAPPIDTNSFEKHFTDGTEILVVRHILIAGDKAALKPARMDSVKRFAEGVLKQTNAANFPAMVKKYSKDPGSLQSGGEYVFPRGQMVAEFDKAAAALKPGEMSGLVQTQFGFHIILRETWAEAKSKFSEAYAKSAQQGADTLFIANLEKGAKVEVKPNIAKTVKALGADVDAFRENSEVLATSKVGNLTASRLARWVAAYPPQARIREQIAQAPDSMMPMFVKYVMRNDLMLHAADSAKITLDTADMNGIRRAFAGSVMNALNGLKISPKQLADSAKTASEREKLAATRVEQYLDALLKNQAQFIDVSEPVAIALHKRFDSRIVTSSIDRAVVDAVKLKAQSDSNAAKAMPSSVVPMPGAVTPSGTPPAAPPVAAPAKSPDAKAQPKKP